MTYLSALLLTLISPGILWVSLALANRKVVQLRVERTSKENKILRATRSQLGIYPYIARLEASDFSTALQQEWLAIETAVTSSSVDATNASEAEPRSTVGLQKFKDIQTEDEAALHASTIDPTCNPLSLEFIQDKNTVVSAAESLMVFNSIPTPKTPNRFSLRFASLHMLVLASEGFLLAFLLQDLALSTMTQVALFLALPVINILGYIDLLTSWLHRPAAATLWLLTLFTLPQIISVSDYSPLQIALIILAPVIEFELAVLLIRLVRGVWGGGLGDTIVLPAFSALSFLLVPTAFTPQVSLILVYVTALVLAVIKRSKGSPLLPAMVIAWIPSLYLSLYVAHLVS